MKKKSQFADLTPFSQKARGRERRQNSAHLPRSADPIQALQLIGRQNLLELRGALRVDGRDLRLQSVQRDDRFSDRVRIGIGAAERLADGLLLRLRLLRERLERRLPDVQNVAPGRNLIRRESKNLGNNSNRVRLLLSNGRSDATNRDGENNKAFHDFLL